MRNSKQISLFIIVTALTLLSTLGLSGRTAFANDDVSVSATLSDTRLALDETGVLTIVINGAKSPQIHEPEVDGLILQQNGKSSQFQLINGSFSASVTLRYAVQGTKEGTFTIPPFTVKANGKTLKTEPLKLEITAPAQQLPPNTGNGAGTLPQASQSPQSPQAPQTSQGDASSQSAFILVQGVPDEVYVGQRIPVTIHACFVDGLRVQSVDRPQLNSETFVLSPLDDKPEQTVQVINGRRYTVLTWQTTASAVKEAAAEISASLNATILIQQRSSAGSRDPFFDDPFFNNFFNNVQQKRLPLTSKKQQVSVLSLPQQGKPADFPGAIGSFNFSVSASPTTIRPGDPITIKMAISGTGNFDRISAPEFPENSGWKTYTPSANFTDKGGIAGEKTFEQAVVAERSGLHELPPLHFSYFDPEQKKYVTRESIAIPLQVEDEARNAPRSEQQSPSASSGQSSAVQPTPQKNQTAVKPDLQKSVPPATIRLKPGHFVEKIEPIYHKIWFLAVAALCTLILLTLAIRCAVVSYRKKNSTQRNRKRHHRELHNQLTELNKAMQQNDTSAFLQTGRAIVQQLYAAQLAKDPATVTAADIRETAAETSYKLLQTAEQHAYGAITLTQKQMNDDLTALRIDVEERS